MKISVESGKRTPFSFENSKIKVEGSSGTFHNGQISISKDNKVIYANSEKLTSVDSQVLNNNKSVSKKTKASFESLGINKAYSKILNSGQKISVSDISINDNKMVIGIKLDYMQDEFEVDFSMFLLDENGKSSEENFIFYGNKISKNSAVIIDGDLSLGIEKAFNNVISIDLNKISPGINRISLTATLDDESNKFGNLKSGIVNFISSSKKDCLNFKFTEKLSNENAIVVLDIYLHNGNWKIQGVGQGFNGGLAALCKNFGVETM